MLVSAFRVLFIGWLFRWNLLRLGLAGGLLSILVADNGARLARVQFGSLPPVDYLAEVRSLRGESRFAEALLVAETGLSEISGADREALAREQSAIRAEQESVVRRGKELLRGALVGQGDSLEALIGA